MTTRYQPKLSTGHRYAYSMSDILATRAVATAPFPCLALRFAFLLRIVLSRQPKLQVPPALPAPDVVSDF
jgi:hypothetical protein